MEPDTQRGGLDLFAGLNEEPLRRLDAELSYIGLEGGGPSPLGSIQKGDWARPRQRGPAAALRLQHSESPSDREWTLRERCTGALASRSSLDDHKPR